MWMILKVHVLLKPLTCDNVQIMIYSLGSGFELKPSQIPHSGLGVYCTQDYKKGCLLSEYGGDLLTPSQADEITGNNMYLFDLPTGFTLNPVKIAKAQKPESPIGCWINDPLNKRLVNVEAQADENRVLFYAKRDLSKGDELFWSYGKKYWKDWSRVTKQKPCQLSG